MMSNNTAFISDVAAGGSKAYVPALQQAIAKKLRQHGHAAEETRALIAPQQEG
eukprot:COSAG06_NODE_26597_length_611_cov_1.175781_2_plen_52_part_01